MFRTNPLLQIGKPGQWIVHSPLVWAISDAAPHIIVPPGFVTDLASVPRFLRDRKAFDVNGLSRRPAILHDWLYATGMGGKEFADDTFRLALRCEGVGAMNAWAFYQAVHWFGGVPYREHARRRLMGEAPSS
jgi:hypothetical protein